MTISELDATLKLYERAIAKLKPAKLKPAKLKTNKSLIEVEQVTEEQVIKVLNARNDVQLALQELKRVPTNRLQQVIKLDDELRELAGEITKVINSDRWVKLRSSVHSPNDAWWWDLETVAPSPIHKWDRLDWLWKGLTVAVWTGNLSLLLNIATRFLGGGAGLFGAAAVIFPSIMALLQARSELTKAGKAGFDHLLTKLSIPLHFHEEAKFGSTLFMSLFLFTLWLNLPRISQIYNSSGKINYEQGKLGVAEQNYLRAISLDKENLDAHFNLANLYEDLQELDKAKKHYLIGVRGNIPDVYNNLARLYIKDDKNQQYPEAATLLREGLDLALKQKSKPEVKYSLFKNLGWVRFKQGRNQEARKNLEAAINITKSLNEDDDYVWNRASAHCILAQVLDEEKQTTALEQWQKCCEFASRKEDPKDPNEDTWLYEAKRKLKQAGKRCKTKDIGDL